MSMKNKTNKFKIVRRIQARHASASDHHGLAWIRTIFTLAFVGVMLTFTHGAFMAKPRNLNYREFGITAKSDLHTHGDNPEINIYVADPRHIKGIKRNDTG